MADVSVEFGAKDTGLEQTLKTVQDQLNNLESEVKSGTLSFDDLQKKMREIAQAEKTQERLMGMAEAANKVSEATKRAAEPARDLSEEFKKISEPLLTVNDRLTKTRSELDDLKNKLATAHMRTEEFEDALKKVAELEAAERRLSKISKEVNQFGNEANQAEVKVDALGDEADEMGNKVLDSSQKANTSAGIFDSSFAKISAAFAVGNIAAKGFEKIVQTAFDIARASVQAFGDALDLGARLNALSARTGEAAGSLLVLETAFKNNSVEATQVGVAINKLQKFMSDAAAGGERQTGVMNKLGVSLAELEGKTPTEQMKIFADRLTAIEDPTERAATAAAVFGDELGGKLLPVFTDFSGNLDDARNKVGSLEQVMNENAATFDAAGNTIEAVKAKLTAFAAGILSEVIPEVQNLGTSMEEVDAAGLGQRIGEALAPVLRDLNSLVNEAAFLIDELAYAEQQAREDTGALGTAYRTTEGALQTFNNALFDALSFITPFDESIEALRSAFVGVQDAQSQATSGIEDLGEAAGETTPKLDEAAASADNVSASLTSIGGEGSFASINEGATQFKSLLGDSEIALSDMTGEITSQLPLQTEQVGLVGELNTSLGGVGEQMSAQLELLNQQNIAEAERNAKIAERQQKSQKDYELQIEINKELAAGNTEGAKKLENQRELLRLTERIKNETGLSEDKAAELAKQFLNSKDEAKKTTDEIARLKKGVENVAGTKMDEPAKGLKERTAEAREKLGEMKDFIGGDLSRMSLSSITEKLGLDQSGLQSSEDQLKGIEEYLDTLDKKDPANITPKVEEQEVKDALSQIDADMKMNPKINKEALQNEIDVAMQSSKGTEHLSNIDKLVEKIEQLVSKIEGKLPLQALAY